MIRIQGNENIQTKIDDRTNAQNYNNRNRRRDPNSDHSETAFACKLEVDIVWLARCERCEPHVGVITGAIHGIHQIGDNSRVRAITGKDVDIGRDCCDLIVYKCNK